MSKEKQVARPIQRSDVEAVENLLKMFTDLECRWEQREIQELAEQMLVLWFRVKSLPEFFRHLNEFMEKSDELCIPVGQLGSFMASELRKQES